ncbi:MAG: nodulation protein NfeD [Bacteroidales bacterium]|nr:nodulation protein NfeD [Bacteroidales bacterium]MBN2762076.1 nodulation protein NfeD [Bacteroidales bacterium]
MFRKTYFIHKLFFMIVTILLLSSFALDSARYMNSTKSSGCRVYVYEIRKDIAKPAWWVTQKAFEEAEQWKADYIILHLNTYGGQVNYADSIRTRLLNSTIPVIGFVDNQAISAGALISIACDSIYMRAGGSIGAATVVDQSGNVVPDKYQSFMRSTMRATAEAHGKDTIVSGNDTIIRWHRDPHIAEAMVDPSIVVQGFDDSLKVVTLTAEEALEWHFCEGLASSIAEVMEKTGLKDCELRQYRPTAISKVIGFFLSPVVQGILIMIMLGGIYFELQTPGVGFPLAAAGIAALLYFAPLYLEGLAENWEMLLFLAGLLLLILEIFVIPGFGIAGISGIALMVVGLTLSLVDNVVFRLEGTEALWHLIRALMTVLISLFMAFMLFIMGSKRLAYSKAFKVIALETTEPASEGYIGIDKRQKGMAGKTGIAHTVLRPSGMVEIDGDIFDAVAETGYIQKGEKIKVIRDETGQLYVEKI